MNTLAFQESEVIRTIAVDEGMYNDNEEHYFGVGRSAMECVDMSLQAAGIHAASVKCILDLPCGHGRVLR